MIVEDEKDLCHLLGLMLQKQNLSSACVNSIAEARRAINSISPRVLLLDNHLPDGSGIDFVGQVRSLYPGIKIVMMTAYDTPADVEKAFNKGVDYFISKPFTMTAIKNMLSVFEYGNIG